MASFWKAATLRSLLLGAAASVAITPAVAHAQEQQVEFNIPAQSTAAALNEFSRQAGVQILFPFDVANTTQSEALQGGFTRAEALSRLLRGSTLRLASDDGRTIVLQDPNSPTRLGDASGAAPSDEGATSEILVVGSRTLNADIRRSEDAAQPYVIFDHETIERSGALNAEDFLRRQLSSQVAARPNSQTPGGTFGNTSRIDLRGLGADETLILIDGRRAPSFMNGGVPQQPDINAIPLASIERIEVLPTTASGIYGGGATGGVINIVLRRDFSGGEARVTYGNTFNTDANNRRLDLTLGHTFNSGRTNVMAAVSVSDGSDLLVGDRDFADRANRLILANNPDIFYGPFASPPLGATTNIAAAFDFGTFTRPDLTLKSTGDSLNSPFAYVPVGYDGIGGDAGAAFLATAGGYNFDLADTAQDGGSRQSLVNTPSTTAYGLTVRHEFTNAIDGFVDLSRTENESTSFANGVAGFLNTYALSAASPANPFNQDIVVTPPVLVDETLHTTMLNERAVLGLIGDLPAGWRVAGDYTWARSSMRGDLLSSYNTFGLGTAMEAGGVNVLTDLNEHPADFAQFAAPSNDFGPIETTLDDAAIRLSGPLPFSFGAEAPRASFLLEHRLEDHAARTVAERLSASFTDRRLFPEQSQEVTSIYAETVIPFFGPSHRLPLVQLLELQLAARYDEYTTQGANSVALDADFNPTEPVVRRSNNLSSANPTVGVRYQPVDDVTLRASWGTGFLPPNVNQITSFAPLPINPFFISIFNMVDPLRGNELLGLTGPVLSTQGGNADLQPEETESTSFGVIWTPQFLSGLRLSVDWTEIEKTNAIASITSNGELVATVLAIDPGRITRGPVPPGDPFGVGPITAIDATDVNLAEARIETLDIGLDYRFETEGVGAFTIALNATHLISSTTRASPGAPEQELAGSLGGVGGGGLEWAGSATLSWEGGPWNAAWTTRYSDSYCVFAGCVPYANLGGARVEAQTYHDLFVSRQFGDDIELQLGVNNVFNTAPPFDGVGYSLLGDPRLANYYLSLRKSF